MKIKGFGNNSAGKSSSVKGKGDAGSVSAGKSAASASGGQKATGRAAVSVSGTQQIAQSFASDASKKAERVAQIKGEVESGSYKSDPYATADKLIDSLTDYSLA